MPVSASRDNRGTTTWKGKRLPELPGDGKCCSAIGCGGQQWLGVFIGPSLVLQMASRCWVQFCRVHKTGRLL